MKILFLTQVMPFPPDSGPKIKTYNVLRYLAQRHEIHLVSYVRSAEEAAASAGLKEICKSITAVPLRRSRTKDLAYLARSAVTGMPFLIERDNTEAMRAAISQVMALHDFDAVHADQLSMAQFAVGLQLPLRVLDEHNAVWTIVRRAAAGERGARKIASQIEWRKLRAYEGDVCGRFDLVTVVSNQDYLDLLDAAREVFPAKVIPIAVDCQDMAFRPRSKESALVLSVATMFYPPNIEGVYWFATEVFPLIREELPEAEFVIAGKRPPKKITDLATAGSRVTVAGYVPDLDPLLERTRVMVVPLRSGSGMRVKILEAFSRGLPVVSTKIGVEGIDARDGEQLLVADDPRGFARYVVRVLSDIELANRLAREGRALIESLYDWHSALRPLDEIYRGAMESAGPQRNRATEVPTQAAIRATTTS